jgi:dipeptidyl aminopeptidase/acylaminoacyl peptidase
LATLESRCVQTSNEVSQVFGWSPGDRYLAFAQVAPVLLEAARRKETFVNETWVTIYDAETGSSERVTANVGTVEGSFAWLSTNEFFFSSSPIGKDYAEKFVSDWPGGTRRKVFNYVGDFVLTSPSTAAFVQKGNICTCRIDAAKYPPIEPLSAFRQDDFDSLRWLRYSERNGEFLFCGRPKGSNWRYLFEFEPKAKRLAQLNNEDTYNGQWLECGDGYAYVASRDNHFSLVLHGRSGYANTNLFTGGSVVNYTVAPSGDRVYVTASLGIEPQGIWEYDARPGTLRRLVDGQRKPFVAARLVEPQEFRVKSLDGLEVPCFLFAPASLSSATAREAKHTGALGSGRHPLVIYLPPPSWQFQRAFEQQSQLLANLGFYVLVVNYRGCDGYGRNYSEPPRTAAASDDILAAYAKVVKAAKVDRRNVFLLSNSGGGSLAFDLLSQHPDMWRGAVLDHPSGWSGRETGQGQKLPPMFIISGDQDRFLASLQQFRSWAETNEASVQLLVHTNCGHMNWKTAEIADAQVRVAKFLLSRLR